MCMSGVGAGTAISLSALFAVTAVHGVIAAPELSVNTKTHLVSGRTNSLYYQGITNQYTKTLLLQLSPAEGT